MMRASAEYDNPGDLGVIICLFNLKKHGVKAENFDVCRELYERSGIPLVTMECAFGDAPWALEPRAGVYFARTAAALWQKERLINLALPMVPARCTKIAWIDGDILFANPGWAVEASARLNDLAVVQLADHILRLPRGSREYTGRGDVWESFAAVAAHDPNALLRGDFGVHGHTGFAWAARREMVEAVGLYDACVTGGADHVMAHAFCGDWHSPCLDRMLGAGTAWRAHAAAWAERVYPFVRARVGAVKGAALHLWHGEIASRRHMLRYRPLWAAAFDPARDLEPDACGCWRWRSPRPELRRAVGDYVEARRFEADEPREID